MRSRLPYPRFAPGATSVRLVAAADRVTANYLRMVEKVNGQLDHSDIRDAYDIPDNMFRERRSLECISFVADQTNTDVVVNMGPDPWRLETWALCEIQDFNSSRRVAGRRTQFGWNSALTAELRLMNPNTLLSTITKPAKLHIDTAAARGSLPEGDSILVAKDFVTASVAQGDTLRTAISTTIPANGGYIVYLFLSRPWTVSPEQ